MLLALASSGVSRQAHAWAFPEHTQITERALELLDLEEPAARALFAAAEEDLGLCALDAKAAVTCPTLASLPSLAGDHSCTPGGLRLALQGRQQEADDWIAGVLKEADETGRKLAEAGNDATEREDVRRMMHVNLQSVDKAYLKRAISDHSHFQLAREGQGTDELEAYVRFSVASAREANATASFLNYHLVALRLAADGAKAAPPQQAKLFARAVVSEAFALHFLQDSYSAGHIVGHWGDKSTALGTHDHYSRTGVATVRWATPTKSSVVHGDGFSTPGERDRIARAVAASLRQLIEAARGDEPSRARLERAKAAYGVESYDSCVDELAPPGLVALAEVDDIRGLLADEPVPLLRLPPAPRVRAEKDFFFGGAATWVPQGGRFREETWFQQVTVGARGGFGAAGIVDDPLNAQTFAEVGVTAELQDPAGSGRRSMTGYSLRMRVPSYVAVEGIILMPLAAWLQEDCLFCLEWGTKAAAGGLFGIWSSHRLFDGVFWQISALRDATFHWFRDEPVAGTDRFEILAPFLTARTSVPIAGERWSQSTDFYADLGGSVSWTSSSDKVDFGLFLSVSLAARLFP